MGEHDEQCVVYDSIAETSLTNVIKGDASLKHNRSRHVSRQPAAMVTEPFEHRQVSQTGSDLEAEGVRARCEWALDVMDPLQHLEIRLH